MAFGKKPAAPSAPATTPIIPTLAEASPAYAALVARQTELTTRRNALRTEEARLVDHEFQRLPDGGRSARVESLLGDEPTEHRPTRLHAVREELRDVDLAITEIGRRMATERTNASRTITAQLRGYYDGLVGDLAAALLAAHAAQLSYDNFVRDLDNHAIAWSGALPPMSADRLLGASRDVSGPLAYFLRDAVAAGVISRDDVPSEVRQ